MDSLLPSPSLVRAEGCVPTAAGTLLDASTQQAANFRNCLCRGRGLV